MRRVSGELARRQKGRKRVANPDLHSEYSGRADHGQQVALYSAAAHVRSRSRHSRLALTTSYVGRYADLEGGLVPTYGRSTRSNVHP